MNYFDGKLEFLLDSIYEIQVAENDEGEEVINIKYDVSQNEEGEEQCKYSFNVKRTVLNEFGLANFQQAKEDGKALNCNFDTVVLGAITDTQFLITINILVYMISIKIGDEMFSFSGKNMCVGDDKKELIPGLVEQLELLTTVINSTKVDGQQIEIEDLSAERIYECVSDDEEEDEEDEDASDLGSLLDALENVSKGINDVIGEMGETEFPFATPGEEQHEHLDFQQGTKNSLGIFGGLLQVNQTGTEYSFENFVEYFGESEEQEELAENIANSISKFELAAVAEKFSEVFRVNADVFNPSEDREQEILQGYLRRAYMYDGLRSFAWTIGAYCDKNNLQLEDLDLQLLREIADFVVDREYLNFEENSFCPTLCAGNDIHIYFVPDKYCDEKTLEILTDGEVDGIGIQSLDGLRADLEYLYPVMKLIHDDFDEYRDDNTVLEGSLEDVLYAWCSMTYAAQNAIFTEDGPMNCFYDHPDVENPWEASAKEEWLSEYSEYLSDEEIIIKDKKFVFSGFEFCDEWDEILERFTELGGIRRTAVSGQTDYLVCRLPYAGNSSANKAIEQQSKGKEVKIVLAERFLDAIGMGKPEKLPRVKKERPAPDLQKMEYIELTYNKGIKFENEKYTIAIPDGFVVLEGEEDRDFIAYLPNEEVEDSSYFDSDFVIYAGKDIGEAPEYFTTPECFNTYCSVAASSLSAGAFGKVKNVPYLRKAMPGALVYSFDNSGRIGFRDNTIHANAFVAVGNTIKGMRVQINEVPKRFNPAYEEFVVKKVFDNMMPKEPVKLIDDVDCDKYMTPIFDKALIEEWVACVDKHIDAIAVIKNLRMNYASNQFQQAQSSGRADIEKLKTDLQNTVDEVGSYIDALLHKCEKVYNHYLCNNNNKEDAALLMNAIAGVVEFSDQEITINGGELAFRNQSEYAKTLLDNLNS